MNRRERMTASSGAVLALALGTFSSPALRDDPAVAQVDRHAGAVVQVAACGDGTAALVTVPTGRTGHLGSMRAV